MKIFHGPANICGIGGHLANWQRQHGYVSDFIVYQDETPQQNNHLNLQFELYRFRQILPIQIAFFIICLFKYDLFNFYAGVSLLPFSIDLPLLKLFNKKIIMVYCGSEARLIEIEKTRNPYADLLKISIDDPKFDQGKKLKMWWQNLWVDRFIAPRNIYQSVVQIIPEKKIEKDLWIHNTIDIQSFPLSNIKTKEIPTLVHAPSEMGIKGTVYVEAAIQKLQEKGYNFNYYRLHKVPNSEALRIYKEEADIIIDQFLLGGFGTLAVEGMFYGKPVCCYLLDKVKAEHYPDCPIVNANIDNLEKKLAWLIKNPDERVKLGEAGRAYVEKYFDRNKINQKLLKVYKLL